MDNHTDERIITHDGIFHADEVMAIALIHEVVGFLPVTRTRKVTSEELEDPKVWVLDQYGRLEPNLRNFDHHQDKNIESTNYLILWYLLDMNYISRELFSVLEAPFKAISAYDRRGQAEFNGFQVNEFFKSLNNQEGGFDVALAMARIWIRGMKGLVVKKGESKEFWKQGEVVMPNVRLCHKYPIFWKAYSEEQLLIAPNTNGTWNLHSADTTFFPIVETPKQIFLHVNKFIAGYPTKTDAIEAAALTTKNLGVFI